MEIFDMEPPNFEVEIRVVKIHCRNGEIQNLTFIKGTEKYKIKCVVLTIWVLYFDIFIFKLKILNYNITKF